MYNRMLASNETQLKTNEPRILRIRRKSEFVVIVFIYISAIAVPSYYGQDLLHTPTEQFENNYEYGKMLY